MRLVRIGVYWETTTRAEAIKRARFIKRAQVLGFTLDDVGSLLELDEAYRPPTLGICTREWLMRFTIR